MQQKILGYYGNWILAEQDGICYVVKRREKVLFKGDEEQATKLFVMLISGFIKEEEL